MSSEVPALSIVIPAYNEADELPNLLRSLSDLPATLALEIIVVDNGSTDGTSAVVSEPNAHVIKIPKAAVGHARNVGAQAARGERLAFLDSDVIVTREWRDAVHEWVLQDGPRNTITGDVYDVVRESSWIVRHWFGAMYRRGAGRYINGGNLLIRRDDFLRVGGFHPTMTSGEDVELCARASQRGFTVTPNRAFRVLHAGYPSTVRGFIAREAWHGQADFKTLHRIIRSPVAVVTLAFLAMHFAVVGLLLAANGSGALVAAILIALLCLGSSLFKWRSESPWIILVNAIVFYLYFVGRAGAAASMLLVRPMADSAGRAVAARRRIVRRRRERTSGAGEATPKVLLVGSTLHVGGAERIIANLAKQLPRDQFRVAVAVLKANGVVGDEMVRDGADLIRLDRARTEPDYFTAMRLWMTLRERKFDIVHTHDTHGLVDATICRRMGGRFRHVHTFHFGNYPDRDPSSRRIERLCWRSPDRLVAVGYHQRRAIIEAYGMPKDRVEVIWNGVSVSDPLEEPESMRHVRASGRPVIASISTLTRQKGIETLLHAAALTASASSEFELVIVGDGTLRPDLERLARELGIHSRVHFLGWVPEASGAILPYCDIFVQSSLWEAMSVVVLEAMAASKPMVVTDVGENARITRDGDCAIVTPAGDKYALARGLEVLLKDAGLRSRLGSAGQRLYLSDFTLSRMIASYAELYRSVLRESAQ